jgi:4-amino-4-deoxy-L-arabinose transferase-like glycosyltransferase
VKVSSPVESAEQSLWRTIEGRFAAARSFDLALCLMVVCAAGGIALRVRNMAVIPLWLDEAGWARILVKTSLLVPSIRPIGFMALSKLSVSVFGATEFALRLLPCLCGVATTVLVVPLARQLFSSRAAQLLLVAAIAFHPTAIDYAKEFKPYAVSLLLHLLCLCLVLRYAKRRERWALLGSLFVAVLGPLFAQDVVFALPGLFLVLGLNALREARRWHVVSVLLGGALSFSLILFLFLFAWRTVDHGEQAVDFWGGKYDVFYVPGSTPVSRLRWLLGKWLDMTALPGDPNAVFGETGSISAAAAQSMAYLDSAIWLVLHVLGLALLGFRRRFAELALLGLPLVLCAVFNQLSYWPFGAFRTNLFLLAYVCPLAALAFDSRTVPEKALWPTLTAGALVLAPLLLFERDWHAHKAGLPGVSSFTALTSTLFSAQGEAYDGPPEALVLDGYTCPVWSYYLNIHPGNGDIAAKARQRFVARCANLRRGAFSLAVRSARRAPGQVWIVATHPNEMQGLREAKVKGLHIHELADKSAIVASLNGKRSRM